uniref:Uncharacterized protein n=1 Tax=Siphoviridae sp. ctoiA13 TaxID=2826462 RepID=A0A8S5QXU3_9CAUD|nr:MAG TPA: hypothetical protein [Siphoviridae sp. ctoiA13]
MPYFFPFYVVTLIFLCYILLKYLLGGFYE